MIFITKTDQGYYGLADAGSSDVVGPYCKTALQAYNKLKACCIESEAWATQMLKDEADGKIEYYYNEPRIHPDGTVEMTGGWRKHTTN